MWVAILAAAAVAAGAGTPAPANGAAPAAEEAKPDKAKKARSDMVCIRESSTGSNRPTKVCYPRKARPADTGAARMPEVDAQR